jgi:hypothetical protein
MQSQDRRMIGFSLDEKPEEVRGEAEIDGAVKAVDY